MDQRLAGLKFKPDGTVEYTIRMERLKTLTEHIRTLNLAEIDLVRETLLQYRNETLDLEEKEREKINGRPDPV